MILSLTVPVNFNLNTFPLFLAFTYATDQLYFERLRIEISLSSADCVLVLTIWSYKLLPLKAIEVRQHEIC